MKCESFGLSVVFWRYFVVVTVMAVLAYLPGVDGPLLFDSHVALTVNSDATADLTVADSWRVAAQSSDSSFIGRPMTMLTFAVQHAFAESWVNWQLKLGNVFIHLLIGGLFYALVIKLLEAPTLHARLSVPPHWVALLAAGLWLSHPLFVSTVLYTVQRMAQLSTLWVVLGLLCYACYRSNWLERKPQLGEVLALGLWLFVITIMAVLSKENGLLLLWLIPAVELCFYSGRVNGCYVAKLKVLTWVALVAPLFVVAVFYWVSPDWFERQYIHRDYTLAERVMTQARVLWHYLVWLVIPNVNCLGLHHDDIVISRELWKPASTLLALLSWPLLIALAVWKRKRWPLFLFAVLFYLIGHAMESSVLGLEMVYEHRNYMPLMGVFFLLAWLLVQVSSQLSGWRRFAPGVCVLLCCLLLTGVRSDRWSDEIIMGAVNARNHPESARSQYQYGSALYGVLAEKGYKAPVGVLRRAREQYLHMLALNPNGLVAPVTLLSIDSNYPLPSTVSDSWLERIAQSAHSTELVSEDRNALALLVECVGKRLCKGDDQVVLDILSVLDKRFPNNGEMKYLQAQLLSYRSDRWAEAVRLIRQALDLSPGNIDYHYVLIGLLVKQEDHEQASRVLADLSRVDTSRRELLKVKYMLGESE